MPKSVSLERSSVLSRCSRSWSHPRIRQYLIPLLLRNQWPPIAVFLPRQERVSLGTLSPHVGVLLGKAVPSQTHKLAHLFNRLGVIGARRARFKRVRPLNLEIPTCQRF